MQVPHHLMVITPDQVEVHLEVMGLPLQVLEEAMGVQVAAEEVPEGAEGVTEVLVVKIVTVHTGEVAPTAALTAAAVDVTLMDHLEAAAEAMEAPAAAEVMTAGPAVAAVEAMVTAALVAAADMEAAVAAAEVMEAAVAAEEDLEAIVAAVVEAEDMLPKTKFHPITKFTLLASQPTSLKKTSLHFLAQLV